MAPTWTFFSFLTWKLLAELAHSAPPPLSFLFYCLEKTAIFSIYGRLDLTIISEIWNIFYSKENREKLDFSVVLFRGQRPLLEKRFNSVQITERRISHIKLGEVSVMKEVPHCTRGPHKSAWQCMSGRDDFGQPPEDSWYPVINSEAKWSMVDLSQCTNTDDEAQSLVAHFIH